MKLYEVLMEYYIQGSSFHGSYQEDITGVFVAAELKLKRRCIVKNKEREDKQI
ncbi:hypothetical protein [Bacillus wiedmannii]|nr:hypothetical protein [Bacillus wiedmannii]